MQAQGLLSPFVVSEPLSEAGSPAGDELAAWISVSLADWSEVSEVMTRTSSLFSADAWERTVMV